MGVRGGGEGRGSGSEAQWVGRGLGRVRKDVEQVLDGSGGFVRDGRAEGGNLVSFNFFFFRSSLSGSAGRKGGGLGRGMLLPGGFLN